MTADKPRRLGRGLEALIPGGTPVATAAGDLQRIAVGLVRPNPYQPRREFDASELAELEASLKSSGLLQPITVRRKGDAFELVTGERRLRAASNLGWTEIQALVRDFDEQTMLVLALVENLQRTDLNAIEEARGYRRLVDDFGLTQQQIAEAVGKDRTTVTNLLRVLSLPDPVQRMVEDGRLSVGHARALLALSAPHSSIELALTAAAQRISVRELERRVRELMQGPDSTGSKQRKGGAHAGDPAASNPAVRALEDELRRYLQTDIRLHVGAQTKGTLQISFFSQGDLERLVELILREGPIGS